MDGSINEVALETFGVELSEGRGECAPSSYLLLFFQAFSHAFSRVQLRSSLNSLREQPRHNSGAFAIHWEGALGFNKRPAGRVDDDDDIVVVVLVIGRIE